MKATLLVLALLPRLVLAEPAPGLEGPIPSMPDPKPSAYVSPLTLVGDGLPEGTFSVRAGEVCYDGAAHFRLLLQVKGAERVSDLRARESWRAGWLAGVEAMGPRVEAERRSKVEAQVEAAGSNPPVSSWWDTTRSAIPWIVSAALVGVVFGQKLWKD